jgi:hypothetical protein
VTAGVPTAAIVLLVVLVLGVVAGRAKGRFALLPVGLVVLAVAGAVVTGVTHLGPNAAEWTRLLTTTVPLLVTFLAGWLVARGSWFSRIVVIAAAALLLAALPYSTLGSALAGP